MSSATSGTATCWYTGGSGPITTRITVNGKGTAAAGPASIKSAQLALGYADGKAVQPTAVFGPNFAFHFVLEMEGVPSATGVRVVWTALETQSDKDKQLHQEEFTVAGSSIIADLALTHKEGWPTGRYKLDLYLNGQLDRTLEFEVRAGPAIISAALARRFNREDQRLVDPTATFDPTAVIHCVAYLINVPAGTRVKAVWSAIRMEQGQAKDGQVAQTELVMEQAGDLKWFESAVTPKITWSTGRYKVDLYVDDKLEQTLTYEVQS